MAKLVRSRTNRKLAGILGGLSEVVGIDAKMLRILFLVLMFLTAFMPFMLLYVLMIFILPNEQDV
ncbi:PspC domain-containing protein [Neobacillus massiliamazoniensis]|jgi:phage shock protein PspC (stress-responsive transcriptional regulator)|uniref:Putative regulator (Stress mediated) n=1 Tax=Neobacillus massiliamazoniensis TaxID=1499688 RepID=A0A0U1NUM4_9BACI|nr:PspC domain-containing protein [Neobacillus massiliamazoniensis]CRK81448.1 putative regulator (stress mediated) [Neobacillus massiliamazoniensis]